MNGLAETSRVGRLEGFFDCMACEECPTSILSLTDVEDIYPVTFVQGESITIHMDHRDVVFARRDKLYVAGFSVWVVDSDDRVQEMNEGLNLMTAAERESLYTRREVRKALEAAEFLRALGYPSEHEAVKLVRSGNVRNIPYSVDDAGRFYDIYGGQVAAIRGQTTKRHVKLSAMADSTARMQITEQELVADVMHIADQNFLISVRSLLELVLACHLKSLSRNDVGTGVQKHINILHSRGYEPKRIMVDLHKTLVSLQNAYPGTVIEPAGAGDHLDKVDIRIRRLKEIMRSVVNGLPYKLSKERLKDLVTYAVSRMNLQSTVALNNGAFLCADMDETEEVYMFLDNMMSEMCVEWMPKLKDYLRYDGKLTVKVDKAMYRLIQSTKLWYNELTSSLEEEGFKKCMTDECVLVKRTTEGSYIIVLLYVDDILIMSGCKDDRHWVKEILEKRYGKVTTDDGNRLPYLGMTIVKQPFGYEISMSSYITDTLRFYGKKV